MDARSRIEAENEARQAEMRKDRSQEDFLWGLNRTLREAEAGFEAAAREDLPGLSWPAAERCMHFRFPVLVPGGRGVAELMAAFESRGVAVRRPVDILPHRFAAGCEKADFPVAPRAWERVLSLPIYPGLADGERDAVMAAARQVLGGAA